VPLLSCHPNSAQKTRNKSIEGLARRDFTSMTTAESVRFGTCDCGDGDSQSIMRSIAAEGRWVGVVRDGWGNVSRSGFGMV
jgi:hypothetical protein